MCSNPVPVRDEDRAGAPDPDLEGHLTLANGCHVHIRPLRRCDVAPIRDLDRHLSARSRHLRFLSPMREVPPSVLKLLSCVDNRRQVALLAVVERPGRTGVVVALGNLAATGDHTAEVGVVVRDDYQRQGIGRAVIMRLLLSAETRGFDRFVADVFCDNVVMRRLIERVGVVLSTTIRRGVCEVSFVRRDSGIFHAEETV